MATTTNYGWTTPDDTALVKDGASAIRSLGTSVDTTTKNLNPSTTLGDIEYRSSTANVNTRLPLGTAGQVLKVNSGATAPEWATDATGMTNPMTTTGDTIYSSSGSTPARLGIGSTGNVLTVAAGVPTWAAPAATTPSFAGVQLTASSSGSQTIGNNSFTKLTWDVENYDVGGFATAGDTITIPTGKSGYYLVIARGYWDTNTAGTRQIAIYKNGTRIYMNNMTPAGTNNYPTSMVQAVFYAAATDTIEAYVKQTSGGSLAIFKSQTNDEGGCLSAAFLGA
jgi:hypothetical protein